MPKTQNNLNIDLNEDLFAVDYKKEIENIITSFEVLKNEFDNEMDKKLSEELSKTDQMRNDLLHIIEFYNFNAAEGFYFAKMLQKVLTHRRKIKNKMEEKRELRKLIKTYNGGLKNLLRSTLEIEEEILNNQSNRTYEIRQLKQLEEFNNIVNEKQKRLGVISIVTKMD